ncbi:hypothetical protein [Chryseobacterium sp.]|uniref:hypothetical protein n=1 Tax=Chryseobacterium sp. TaxID=1871047 RepID=UPI0011C74B7F|nr:hypothetical protein [Chryseobacterium sp.]TXF79231.1 hypothetical protein FUA25_02215 [Chryseobacterium sp.]
MFKETPILLKTSNQRLKTNFDSCLSLTRQLINKQISEKEFSEYFHFNNIASGFEYDNVILGISDSLSEMPKSYQIFYDFVYKGDTISSFRSDFDANIKIIDYRKFHLLAFRKFIDKDLLITKTKATEIALNNGMKEKDLDLILNCTTDKFYWKCENKCDNCLYLEIDAKTGNIIGRGKVVNRY